MRVEEIIHLDLAATRGARAARVAADEPEELLANLPKIIEALLGLDTSQAATGWLNQQAELSNPMLNPKLAVELQASLFRLLSADGERSVVARLLAEYSADRSAPAVRQRPVYNFFTSQLTAAAVRALEVGQPGLMPAIFANLLPPGALHHAWPVQSFAAPPRCRRRPAVAAPAAAQPAAELPPHLKIVKLKRGSISSSASSSGRSPTAVRPRAQLGAQLGAQLIRRAIYPARAILLRPRPARRRGAHLLEDFRPPQSAMAAAASSAVAKAAPPFGAADRRFPLYHVLLASLTRQHLGLPHAHAPPPPPKKSPSAATAAAAQAAAAAWSATRARWLWRASPSGRASTSIDGRHVLDGAVASAPR